MNRKRFVLLGFNSLMATTLVKSLDHPIEFVINPTVESEVPDGPTIRESDLVYVPEPKTVTEFQHKSKYHN